MTCQFASLTAGKRVTMNFWDSKCSNCGEIMKGQVRCVYMGHLVKEGKLLDRFEICSGSLTCLFCSRYLTTLNINCDDGDEESPVAEFFKEVNTQPAKGAS